MRHVDQAALAFDLGDRLRKRHAARDLFLDEQPDHLALAGRLDLLGHDHLDSAGLAPGVQGPGDLVVIGDRDRAQAPRPRLGQQHLDRRGAVRGVVGMHVQIDVDQLPRPQPLAHAAVGPRVVAARHQPRVDRLELAGHAGPRERLAQSADLLAFALAQLRFGDQPRQVAGQRLQVTGLELESVAPVGQ
jgi:hypothetical protein